MGFCRPCIGNVFSPVTATQNDCSSFPGLFLIFFAFPDLHFCVSLLYYTPFAPSTGRGAENQVQQNLKNLQTKI